MSWFLREERGSGGNKEFVCLLEREREIAPILLSVGDTSRHDPKFSTSSPHFTAGLVVGIFSRNSIYDYHN